MKLSIIGAPVDLGADRRGVDMGVSAIRYASLEQGLRDLGHEVTDLGNVSVPIAETTEEHLPDLKYLQPIVRACEELERCVRQQDEQERFPLVLGGDHSISLGVVAGVARARRIGLVWFDAHADFNTSETSPSGNIHGMVLAALAGQGDPRLVNIGAPGAKVDTAHVAVIGARALDGGERDLLRRCGVHVYTMHDVDRRGVYAVVQEATALVSDGVDGVHLSLDLDVVDPLYAPGVGTPVVGGLTYREAHLAMEMVSDMGCLTSMDVVEVNPILDRYNETAALAVELTLSATGKRIY